MTLYHESILDAAGNELIGPMPPTKQLKPEYIFIFEQWVLAVMPETEDEATALEAETAPVETEAPEGEESTSP